MRRITRKLFKKMLLRRFLRTKRSYKVFSKRRHKLRKSGSIRIITKAKLLLKKLRAKRNFYIRKKKLFTKRSNFYIRKKKLFAKKLNFSIKRSSYKLAYTSTSRYYSDLYVALHFIKRRKRSKNFKKGLKLRTLFNYVTLKQPSITIPGKSRHTNIIFPKSSTFKRNVLPLDSIFSNSNLLTKHKHPHILSNIGLVMPYKFLYKSRKPSVFIIKKKFFSFLKINELKMSIFNIKRRLLLGKIFFMLTRTKKLKKVYKLTNKSMYNFFKNFNNTFSRNTKGYVYDKLVVNEDLFRHANIIKAAKKGRKKRYGRELRIPRVKFKPGYQRL